MSGERPIPGTVEYADAAACRAEARAQAWEEECDRLRTRLAEVEAENERRWHIISDLELAVIALGLPDLVEKWGEPRHRTEIGVKLPTSAGTVYQVYDAWRQANWLMNEGKPRAALAQTKEPEHD